MSVGWVVVSVGELVEEEGGWGGHEGVVVGVPGNRIKLISN